MEFIKYLDKSAGKAAILSRSDNNLKEKKVEQWNFKDEF